MTPPVLKDTSGEAAVKPPLRTPAWRPPLTGGPGPAQEPTDGHSAPEPSSEKPEASEQTLLFSQRPPAQTFDFLNEEPRASPTNKFLFVATHTKNTSFLAAMGGEAAPSENAGVTDGLSRLRRRGRGAFSPELGLRVAVVAGYAEGRHRANALGPYGIHEQ